MKKLFLILLLSLYTYISQAQETSKIGHLQGLTYYHEKMIENNEKPSEGVIYYPEEKSDTVYIITKVIIEKPVRRPRVTINLGMGWGFNHWNHWNYAPYYGWGWNYDPYSYWGYPRHRYYGYYGWNHHYYDHNFWYKKTSNNYRVRTNQRYTNVSQIRKPQTRKIVSNSERRIKQSTYDQSRRTKSRDYDQMYPSSRSKVTRSSRNTKYVAPRNKPIRNNSYKRTYKKSSNSNTYRSKSYSTPSRSNSSSYSAPSRSSRSSSLSSGSRSSSSRSSSSGTRSSSRSSGSSRGGRQ